jgi:CRP-like cAMP-binding protein
VPNQLLHSLEDHDLAFVHDCLEPVSLTPDQILEAPSQSVEHVYFLESGMASVLAISGSKHRIEVAMIGNEGVSGLPVALGGDRSINETVVRSPGTAMRMSSVALRKAMRDSATFAAILHRYAQVFVLQASQTALANGRGKLEERLARWLSMWRTEWTTATSGSRTHGCR